MSHLGMIIPVLKNLYIYIYIIVIPIVWQNHHRDMISPVKHGINVHITHGNQLLYEDWSQASNQKFHVASIVAADSSEAVPCFACAEKLTKTWFETYLNINYFSLQETEVMQIEKNCVRHSTDAKRMVVQTSHYVLYALMSLTRTGSFSFYNESDCQGWNY